MTTNDLTFDDLRDPVLTPTQQAMVEFADSNPVDYTVDAVLAGARKATGLTDPGPDGWDERLQLWIDAASEPNRTNLARMTMLAMSVTFLSNRMQVHDFAARHPEVREIEIKAPVMVIGPPRTGTSHLVNLLAADSRFRSAPLWELKQPVPGSGDGAGPDGVDQRFKNSVEGWKQAQLANPYLKAWHPMDPWRIEEDIELHAADFSSYYPEALLQHAETWRDYYLAHDQTEHYEFQKLCMQVMTWHRPRERWVTKYPAHIENLQALLNVFPDAILVDTHRDPVRSILSFATMATYSARMWQQEFDPEFLLDYWTNFSLRMIEAGLRDRHLIEGQVIDINYQDLAADNWTAVHAVYDKAGIELTDHARTEIQAFIDSNPPGKDGRIVYDLQSHFGVDPEHVRKPFAEYLQRHAVPIEMF